MSDGTMVWVDGKILPAGEAVVGALDHGLTVGDGIFETMKVVGGAAFSVRRHLVRLHRSAAALELGVPDDADLRSAIEQTIAAAAAAGSDVGRVRLTLTGGPGPLGSDRDDVPTTVIVAAAPASPWSPTTEVFIVPWVRNERGAVSGAKTTSYAENVVALNLAHAEGSSEAIFANTVGALCEGTGSNVFVVRDGRLLTPALTTGCLAGITRELLLEILPAGGLPVEESVSLTLDDLRTADEAFLTSSTRDIHPIAVVDHGALTTPAPGPVTSRAMELWAQMEARSLDP